MLTMNDVQFNWSIEGLEERKPAFSAVAVGIDGTIEYMLHTYSHVYDMLSKATFQDATSRYEDDKLYVDVLIENSVVETIEVYEILWALFLSGCVFIELIRDASTQAPASELGYSYYTEKGWGYKEVNGTFMVVPPSKWVPPLEKTLEEQSAHLKATASRLLEMIRSHPDREEHYVKSLLQVEKNIRKLEDQIKDKNGQA